MKKIRIIILFIFSLSFCACASFKPYNYQLQPKVKNTFRLASYNVNWGNGVRPVQDAGSIIRAIANTKADMVLLQETTPFWEKVIKKTLAKQFPYIKFKHFPHAGGLAVLSKTNFQTWYYGETGIGWHPVWIIVSRTPQGLLQIANVHLNPPLVSEGNMGFFAHAVFTTGGKRRQEAKFIYKHLQKNLPTIIAGDFNEGDLGYAVKWLRQHGFYDANQITQTRSHTWEWSFGWMNFYDCYDRVFFNKSLTLHNFQVVHWGSSDHYPVVADFSV